MVRAGSFLCRMGVSMLVGWVCVAPAAFAQAHTNLFFLHHSTGRNLIDEGEVRAFIAAHNASHDTEFALWDHDYNWPGLRDPEGNELGYGYEIPNDNTDPDGLHYLWTVPNSARDSIMANHEVIAFKSCYPASHIESDAKLAQYQAWYLEMRDYFDLHPERIFVVMSPPPLHRLDTNTGEADRARAFAQWLASPTYLAGHANVVCFDLFDNLAHPNDGSTARNRLRYEYEQSHSSGDSHPNLLANQTVGPVFAQFLIDTAEGSAEVPDGRMDRLLGRLVCHPNPMRTTLSLSYETAAPGRSTIALYDLAGRRVAVLLERSEAAGHHEVVPDLGAWRAAAAPGVYWAVLERDGLAMAREKLVLIR
ncbi:MAG: hypothetical protein V1774_02070 [Candidatus Eisenbacteria bacterium]